MGGEIGLMCVPLHIYGKSVKMPHCTCLQTNELGSVHEGKQGYETILPWEQANGENLTYQNSSQNIELVKWQSKTGLLSHPMDIQLVLKINF